MSGTVGVIADAASRYSFFSQCLTSLRLKTGTIVDWEIGSDRSRSRNNLVGRALDRGSEWVLFIDDDQSFRPDLLMMLDAANQPVVAALCLQRTAPFMPLVYADKDEKGYWPLDLRTHGGSELVQVRAVGSGGMMVRTEVFREIPEPWFLHTTEQSEDMYFCDRLAEHDIPLFCHTGARLGHIAPAVVFPTLTEDNQWSAGIQFAYTTSVVIPIDYEYVFDEAKALR